MAQISHNHLSINCSLFAWKNISKMDTQPPDILLKVEGMMCQKNCGSTVQSALQNTNGVKKALVTHPEGIARIWMCPGSSSLKASSLVEAVEDVGYGAELLEDNRTRLVEKCEEKEYNNDHEPDIILEIDGMMCQKNCGSTVQNALQSIPAVSKAIVSYPERKASVWIKREKYAISSKILISAVEDVGYDAKVLLDSRKLFGDESFADLEEANSSSPNPDLTILVKGIDKTDAAVIERMLLTMEGVFNVTIDTGKKIVNVWGIAERNKIVSRLVGKGYRVDHDESDDNGDTTGNEVEMVEIRNPVQNLIPKGKFLKLKVNGSKQAEDITTNLNSMPHLQAELSKRTIIITYDDKELSEERLRNILTERGWSKFIILEDDTSAVKPGKKEFKYSIRGMSCGNCAVKIEKALAKMPGVVKATVSVMTHQGLAVVDDTIYNACGPRDLMDKVKDLGYECELVIGDKGGSSNEENERELAQWRRLTYISVVFGVPVLVLHLCSHYFAGLMMFMMQPALCHGGIQLGQIIMIILNSIMLFTVGYKFYRGALVGAIHGSFGMDFLVMTGTFITFAYSTIKIYFACTLQQPTENVFFEVSGMLLLFVTIGKYIESYAKGKSATSVAELLKLQPREAYLVSDSSADQILDPDVKDPHVLDEHVQLISVDLLQKGDVVKVLPGGRIPTDGRIIFGSSYVDESTITGESNPVRREKGDEVFGSTVNQDNCFFLSVTSYGTDSALAQIVRLVESAQMNKAPVQQFADRLAGIFTPIVLLLALTTFIVWYSLCATHVVPKSWFEEEYNDPVLFSLLFAISVVVISCPCALGLATPTAIMVGTTVGASNGILIKGGSAFEVAHKVDTIVFDKTGTLTEGKPSLTDVIVVANKLAGKVAEDSLMILAATAEQRSEHPLALAVMRSAKARGITALPLAEDAAISVVGSGVTCDCALGRILIGNRGFMKSQDIVVNAVADSAMWNLEIQGKTAIIVALNDEVQGVLGLADVPKPEADNAVRTLRSMGIDIWMLTGDNATTAEALAHKLDISQDRVLAGLLPQDKVSKVKELQAQGHVVAMIGDGVNDSPALAQADLGVAIGAGTQIAIEAASMVLVRSSLHDLVVAFDLAKLVFRRIRWNFMWALIYNVVAVPFAAGVWFPWTHVLLPPHYAGLAMALSSISVVVSSMLLIRYRRPPLLDDVAVMMPAHIVSNGADPADNHSLSSSFWRTTWNGKNDDSSSGYNQLPRDEREWEMSLGVDLGLGRAQPNGGDRWNAIRDDVV